QPMGAGPRDDFLMDSETAQAAPEASGLVRRQIGSLLVGESSAKRHNSTRPSRDSSAMPSAWRWMSCASPCQTNSALGTAARIKNNGTDQRRVGRLRKTKTSVATSTRSQNAAPKMEGPRIARETKPGSAESTACTGS